MKNFELILHFFNVVELDRIETTAHLLGFGLINHPKPWPKLAIMEIIGLDADNRPEVEAFFSLAEVEI